MSLPQEDDFKAPLLPITYTSKGKPRKIGVPKFLRSLREILDKEDGSVISWSVDGRNVEIHNIDGISLRILPQYFKHSKYSSFQRQLNYFRFRKWTKTKTNVCTFSHPYFTRQFPDQMKFIRRKNHPENPRNMEGKTVLHKSNQQISPANMKTKKRVHVLSQKKSFLIDRKFISNTFSQIKDESKKKKQDIHPQSTNLKSIESMPIIKKNLTSNLIKNVSTLEIFPLTSNPSNNRILDQELNDAMLMNSYEGDQMSFYPLLYDDNIMEDELDLGNMEENWIEELFNCTECTLFEPCIKCNATKNNSNKKNNISFIEIREIAQSPTDATASATIPMNMEMDFQSFSSPLLYS